MSKYSLSIFFRYYCVPYGLINLGLWFQVDGCVKSTIAGFGSGAVLGYHIGGPRRAVGYSLILSVVQPMSYQVIRTLFPSVFRKSAGGEEDVLRVEAW